MYVADMVTDTGVQNNDIHSEATCTDSNDDDNDSSDAVIAQVPTICTPNIACGNSST